ncbi:hypothetical protein S40288_10654 [Stachybotrys chartarum IBT 40288]|nr:hypothetical protein S40288_10654 [Stachybotrys chartarum IBT 40288]
MPEVVHCGLGLGYDMRRDTAVNPKDGSPISDPEVLLASRLDRAMIDVGLELRKLYPQMVFSSSTRLSGVYLRDLDAEYTADLLTGSLKLKLIGEQGIAARPRALHEVGETVGDTGEQKGVVPTAEVQRQRKEGHNEAKGISTGTQHEEGKQKWWKKF